MSGWAEWVWTDGRLIRGAEATLSVFDRGFLLGDGLFETLRASQGEPVHLAAHLRRLRAGAEVLRIRLPWSDQTLTAAIRELLTANELSEAAVRLTLSRGVGPPGPSIPGTISPTIVLAVRPFTGYPGRWYEPGAEAILCRVVKNERSPLCAVKSTSYLEHILARDEAVRRGAEEALLLNTRGRLVEASSANLFLVIDGCLCTPDLASGCLPGVTRAVVLTVAREHGHETREEALLPEALDRAEEAFLTNSLLGVAPLVRVDGRPVGSGRPGLLTQELAEGYRLSWGRSDP
jgi:branched-chain amino acid aminotransferase